MGSIMSLDMKQALEKAKKIDEGLLATDFHATCVSVDHDDGTRLFFTHALLMKDGSWWMIFTEHHGFHVYHDEDCTVREFEQKWTQISEDLEDTDIEE